MITPPTRATPTAPPAARSGLDTYQTVADTVGGPSLRIKDNIVQTLVVFACIGLGALVGYVGWGGLGAAAGAVAGMIGGTLVSGGVLMVLGWIRAAKKLK